MAKEELQEGTYRHGCVHRGRGAQENDANEIPKIFKFIKVLLYLGSRSQIYIKYSSEPLLLVIYASYCALRVNAPC